MTRLRLLPVWLVPTAILLLPTVALAQQRALTIDEIYRPETRVDFSGRLPTGLHWINDAQYLRRERRSATGRTRLVAVEAQTGDTELYLDLDEVERELAALPGMSSDAARRAARGGAYVWDPAYEGLVVTISNDLYYVSRSPRDGGLVHRLTQNPAVETMPTFSPDGTMVAFVRDHDLVVVDVTSRREWALTSGGGPDLLNGELDWVYQEEIYGRGDFKGFWWSPDSTRLAYLQTDESPVKEFTVVDHLPYRLDLEVTDYPKAGDANPIVRLGVVPAVGGDTKWVVLNQYTPTDMLVVSVGWSRHGDHVVFQVQNREQTWLDLNLGDPVDGTTTRLLQETTPAWVDVHGAPTWLEDDSFVWLSERSGWKHLYHYEADGTLISQVTDGDWELRTLHGVSEDADVPAVYFSGTERSPIGSDVYRINLDGTALARLSEEPGTHRAHFSPEFTYYLDTWSDINTPPQLRLHLADGAETRVVEPNQVDTLAD